MIRSFVCTLFCMAALSWASIATAVTTNPALGSELSPNSFRQTTGDVPASLVGREYAPIDYPSLKGRLDALLPETVFRTRGAKEANIYKNASPSVVLIVTEDGIGSGSVIAADGTILTNWHVIDGYEQVAVIFKPKTEGGEITEKDAYYAKVIRIDKVADLALLRVISPPSKIRPLRLGQLANVAVGADVHAIGHPTGETWTYTKGLISQIRPAYEWKTEQGIEHLAKVIQTQTPISPGSSGGPLLDDKGELIGINSFLAKGNALNFAVSVDDVREFLARKQDRLSQKCTLQVLGKRRDKKNSVDETLIDVNCDGISDAIFFSPDDQDQPYTLAIDENRDGKIDSVIYDGDRDDKWDASIIDTDYDGKADLIGYHPDGELIPTRFEEYTLDDSYIGRRTTPR